MLKTPSRNARHPRAWTMLQETIHGTVVRDPYRWLEDQNSPETRAWIDAENTCTQSVLGPLPGQDAIAKQLGELIKVDTINLPTERGGKYFYSQARGGRGFVCSLHAARRSRRGRGAGGPLDDERGPHHQRHFRGIFRRRQVRRIRSPQRRRRRSRYSFPRQRHAQGTSRRASPRSLSLRHFIQERQERRFLFASLSTDGPRAYYHTMGADPAHDAKIFGDGYGPDKILGVGVSQDGRYALFTVFYGSACDKSEVYIQDLKTGGPIVPIVNTLDGCFQGDIADNTLYLETNWKAPKWRVLAVPLATPSQDHWKEIIPEGESRLEDFRLAGGKIVAQYSHNAASEIKIFNPDGVAAGGIELPQLGTVAGITGRWKGSEVLVSFQSFAVPTTILQYDLATRKLETWAKPNVPIDSSSFEVKQVWYESKDKTRVPMFLFYKKGLQLNGANPTLMTAYGGFDVSETPAFRDDAVLWVERGGVFALPNLRGGGEFGEDWHHAGMLEKKQNVFDDFFAAAEWLIANHYTRPDKLAITGRSNGGLLMGAAMTQRPDLFGAIVCGYPLLDMIRYQKFLVARFWVPEYGSSDDASQFPFLYAYSPYHHVVKGRKYPAVLFITGDSDTRVAPLHARKMAAEMQAAQGGDKPILLLYDTKLGHSEGRPVSKIIEEDTQVLAFFFWQLGVIKP